MCVIAIAHRAAARYPLIVAANRDERHGRRSAQAGWWADHPRILAGRDLEAGGTWLGIDAGGRFAAVTNVVGPIETPPALSRGTLVANFLVAGGGVDRYARSIEPSLYAGFNLLLADRDELRLVSNRHPSRSLEAGIHAFGNNPPGQHWRKVDAIAGEMRGVIDGDRDAAALLAALFELLAGPAARTQGDSPADSVFVSGAAYGTRCSSVLLVDATGAARFVEQSYDPGGQVAGTRTFEFAVAGA